jgi:hypothetical protein
MVVNTMLVKISWNPSDKQLRQFGICALLALPLLGWLTLGRTAPEDWSAIELAAFCAFSAVGLLAGSLAWLSPRSLRIAFVAATLITLPIGLVMGELLLVAVYFGIFTPVALVFRLIGRDALDRRPDAGAASYWTPKAQAASAEQYFRQS